MRSSAAMAARGHGQIVLIGSIAESFPLPMAPIYAASKAGLPCLPKPWAFALATHGVAVTLVSPGFIDTPMSRQVTEPKPFLMTADRAAADHRARARAARPAPSSCRGSSR